MKLLKNDNAIQNVVEYNLIVSWFAGVVCEQTQPQELLPDAKWLDYVDVVSCVEWMSGLECRFSNHIQFQSFTFIQI